MCGYYLWLLRSRWGTQQRNIVATRPVVVAVMGGLRGFNVGDLYRHADAFYPLAVGLSGLELGPEARVALRARLQRFFSRVVWDSEGERPKSQ